MKTLTLLVRRLPRCAVALLSWSLLASTALAQWARGPIPQHDWTVRLGRARFGLYQEMQASAAAMITPSYTTVFLGRGLFTVQMKAVSLLAATGGTLAIMGGAAWAWRIFGNRVR